MIEANMLDAKTRLSQLVDAAERGEKVFLKRNGVFVAEIVPVQKSKFPFGLLRDQVGIIDDRLLFEDSEESFADFTRL